MRAMLLAALLGAAVPPALADGLRGDPAAIAEARAMVETMYDNGYTRYEMISATADHERPALETFLAPDGKG